MRHGGSNDPGCWRGEGLFEGAAMLTVRTCARTSISRGPSDQAGSQPEPRSGIKSGVLSGLTKRQV